MHVKWRFATREDAAVLAEWNFRLIRDEGHRNPMTVLQLEDRMRGFLSGEYKAVIFSIGEEVLGYGLYRHDSDGIFLQQFFIRPQHRRQGFGRAAFGILRRDIWPTGVRLTVDVLCGNRVAVDFWRAVGYSDYSLTLEIMPDENSA